MLILENITKRFKDFYALNQVCLRVTEGEVHTLLGENGAGKSTLMNILSGLYQPTSGEVIYNNERQKIESPQKARQLGIAMVHQHFMLIEAMTVLENIMLCGLDQKGLLLNKESVLIKVLQIQEAYDLRVAVDARVNTLSVGQQQKVEIIKALFNDAQLLILDEPTSVLTDEEAGGLFKIIRKLKEKNKSVIFISHKLKEVMEISDRVTVLRHGKTIATLDPGDYSGEELAGLMIGEKTVEKAYDKREASREIVCELKAVSFHKNSKHSGLGDINLQIKSGEILGVAGIDGNGQSQLAEILTGLHKPDQGARIYQGQNANHFGVGDFIKNGVAHIPEDRNKMGLIGDMEIKENLLIKDLEQNKFSLARGWFLKKKAIRRYALRMKEKYDIRCSGMDDAVRVLSGGNQQKVILARELERNPRFIVAMNPTRGLDIGAARFVYDCLMRARDRGCAILIVSADIDEIIKLSDRIVVMYEGRIMGEVSGKQPNMARISSMMGGKRFETINA